MGTTAQKINYAINATNDIAEGINDLGGEITPLTPLAQFREHLNSIWSNLPKVTATGNDISFQALRGRMDKTFRGDMEQESTTGKNLFSSEMELGTLGSTGNLVDDDRTIRSKNFIEINSETTYTINNNLNCSLFILFYDENYNYLSINNNQGVPKTFSTPANTRYIKVRTRQSEDITDISIKIMLEQGSTASNWEPYTGGIPSPSPDYPMPIKVVHGKQTIKFNNRLPKEYTEVDYITGGNTQYINTGLKGNQDTKIIADMIILGESRIGDTSNTSGAISIYAEASGTQGGQRFGSYSTVILFNTPSNRHIYENSKNGFYIDNTLIYEWEEISNFETQNNLMIGRMNSKGNSFNFKLYSCKIYDNNTLVRDFVPCYRDSDNEIGLYDLVNNTFYTNQGTGVFTYGNVVTEIKELNLKSKNLANINIMGKVPSLSNGQLVNLGGSACTDYILIDNSKEYTLSFTTNYAVTTYISFYGDNNLYLGYYQTTNNNITLSSSNYYSNCKSVRLRFDEYNKYNFIQLEQGSATSYEPYFDYELCKIDTYEDSIYKNNGKWYKYSGISKVVLDGSKDVNAYSDTFTNVYRFSINTILNNVSVKASKCYCNCFIWYANQSTNYTFNDTTKDIEAIHIRDDGAGFGFKINKDRNISSANAFKSWLAQQYSNGTPVIVYYVLATPTNTEITSPTLISQLQALQNQRSINGTNTITSQCEEGLPVRIGVSALLKEVS